MLYKLMFVFIDKNGVNVNIYRHYKTEILKDNLMNILKILANSSIDDVENVCKKFGVNIKNNDGSYKTIDRVFNDISKVLNNFKKLH